MNMRSTALAATVAITLSAGPAGAQDGLEIGVWAQPENAIYGEREWRQNVYPYIRWQKDRWKIDGDRASFDLLRAADGGWTFGPEVRVEFDGYEADESPLLTGMNLRADPVFAGASGQIELGWLELEAFAGHNVRDGGGAVVDLELGLDAPLAAKLLGFAGVGVRYGNAAYTNHLYGVRAAEARPGRPAYAPGASFVPYFELGAAYELSPRWTLEAGIEFLRLNSAIRHSPIVDAGSRTEGYVGILYRFH